MSRLAQRAKSWGPSRTVRDQHYCSWDEVTTCSKSEVPRHENCADHNARSEYVAQSCHRCQQNEREQRWSVNRCHGSTLVIGHGCSHMSWAQFCNVHVNTFAAVLSERRRYYVARHLCVCVSVYPPSCDSMHIALVSVEKVMCCIQYSLVWRCVVAVDIYCSPFVLQSTARHDIMLLCWHTMS